MALFFSDLQGSDVDPYLVVLLHDVDVARLREVRDLVQRHPAALQLVHVVPLGHPALAEVVRLVGVDLPAAGRNGCGGEGT